MDVLTEYKFRFIILRNTHFSLDKIYTTRNLYAHWSCKIRVNTAWKSFRMCCLTLPVSCACVHFTTGGFLWANFAILGKRTILRERDDEVNTDRALALLFAYQLKTERTAIALYTCAPPWCKSKPQERVQTKVLTCQVSDVTTVLPRNLYIEKKRVCGGERTRALRWWDCVSILHIWGCYCAWTQITTNGAILTTFAFFKFYQTCAQLILCKWSSADYVPRTSE